jgi:hypothetical protein
MSYSIGPSFLTAAQRRLAGVADVQWTDFHSFL